MSADPLCSMRILRNALFGPSERSTCSEVGQCDCNSLAAKGITINHNHIFRVANLVMCETTPWGCWGIAPSLPCSSWMQPGDAPAKVPGLGL